MFVETFYGVADYPNDGPELAGLLRKAKIALEKIEDESHYISQYQAGFKDKSSANIQLLHDLSHAIEAKELSLFYQPKVHLATGKIRGVEGLVRWDHAKRGLLSPGDFLPLLEQTLLINPFTHWLIEYALNDLKAWQQAGMDLRLAINFSVKNFHDPQICSYLLNLADQLKINPKHIEIEITETAVTTDMSDVIKALHSLREKGVKIAIDDFGTGQASQRYLYELPLDSLKIDQIFIRSLGQDPASEAIVKSAILLGHQLKLEVVAEGIETQEQFEILKNLGCDMGQGYGIAHPMSKADLKEWLHKTDSANTNAR